MLEPCEGKLSRTVLRGERGGNAPDPPGPEEMTEQLTPADYAALSWCYVICCAPTYLLLVLGGITISLPALWAGRGSFIWLARSITVFLVALFCTGFLLNIVWNILIFGRYYWQYDYSGWECSPFGLLIYEEPQNPARFFHGTHEKTIRNWHSVYLLLSWMSAYVLSLFVNNVLDKRTNRANQPAHATSPKGAEHGR